VHQGCKNKFHSAQPSGSNLVLNDVHSSVAARIECVRPAEKKGQKMPLTNAECPRETKRTGPE